MRTHDSTTLHRGMFRSPVYVSIACCYHVLHDAGLPYSPFCYMSGDNDFTTH